MVSVLNTIDTAHEDMIHDAQMDYYGTKLATCSSDKSVKIFEVRGNSQTLIATLNGHDGPVWQVAWSHPMFGSLLASCGYDRKVIVWKDTNNSWSKLYEYSSHDSSINSVSWAPHELGIMLACASSDGSISIISTTGDGTWDSKKVNNAHTIGCNAVSWAPALTPNGVLGQNQETYVKRFVSGGCDNNVKIWRESDGEWVEDFKLDGHSDWVRDVAWAPSIGIGKDMIASCGQDCRVLIWTNEGDSWTSTTLNTFNDVVWHVSWSMMGNMLAVSGGDNKVSVWKQELNGGWASVSDMSERE